MTAAHSLLIRRTRSGRSRNGDVGKPLESFDVRALLHHASCQTHKRQIACRINPVHGATRTKIAERARRGQRSKMMVAHHFAAEKETDTEISRGDLPATCHRKPLEKFIGFVTGPVSCGEIENGR